MGAGAGASAGAGEPLGGLECGDVGGASGELVFPDIGIRCPVPTKPDGVIAVVWDAAVRHATPAFKTRKTAAAANRMTVAVVPQLKLLEAASKDKRLGKPQTWRRRDETGELEMKEEEEEEDEEELVEDVFEEEEQDFTEERACDSVVGGGGDGISVDVARGYGVGVDETEVFFDAPSPWQKMLDRREEEKKKRRREATKKNMMEKK